MRPAPTLPPAPQAHRADIVSLSCAAAATTPSSFCQPPAAATSSSSGAAVPFCLEKRRSPILGHSIMYVPQGGTRQVIDAGGLNEIIHNLASGTAYEIRVSACNSVGYSHWSPGARITTASTPGNTGGNTLGDTNNQWCGIGEQGSDGTPGRPNTPTVTVDGAHSITVQWVAPQDNGGCVTVRWNLLLSDSS